MSMQVRVLIEIGDSSRHGENYIRIDSAETVIPARPLHDDYERHVDLVDLTKAALERKLSDARRQADEQVQHLTGVLKRASAES
jgi:hypothetical protein